LISTFTNTRDRIENAGYKVWGRDRFNFWAVFVAVGLMPQGNYTDDMVKTHKEFFDSLKKSDNEAWELFPKLGKEISELNEQISKTIEDFFLDNQMEPVKEEPGPFG